LRSAPVTEGHAAWVTPANWSKFTLGTVSESSVRKDGDLVAAELVVQEGRTIARVDAGELQELSCGYTLDYDPTPGTWNGERYDGVQRNIVYNHVALLPVGQARAGREAALRLDSADGEAAAWCEEQIFGAPSADDSAEPARTDSDEPRIIFL